MLRQPRAANGQHWQLLRDARLVEVSNAWRGSLGGRGRGRLSSSCSSPNQGWLQLFCRCERPATSWSGCHCMTFVLGALHNADVSSRRLPPQGPRSTVPAPHLQPHAPFRPPVYALASTIHSFASHCVHSRPFGTNRVDFSHSDFKSQLLLPPTTSVRLSNVRT